MPRLFSSGQLCPKCGRDVTDRDHEVRNIDGPAMTVPGGGQIQIHWQHKVCPR
jgi:hypothetical protein